MLRNSLTRSILILLLLIITIPLGYSFYTGGESIFPTNDVLVTPTSTHVASTEIAPTHTSEIRHLETPYVDVLPTHDSIDGLTATPAPRSTPYDYDRFQEIVFVNHTNADVRVIITSPNALDIIIEDVVYLDLVYALHWIYIFVSSNVYLEPITNDQLYYVNIFEDRIIIGVHRLQK